MLRIPWTIQKINIQVSKRSWTNEFIGQQSKKTLPSLGHMMRREFETFYQNGTTRREAR